MDLPVQVRIVSSHGGESSKRHSAMFVRACICDDGELLGAPERTRYYNRRNTECEINGILTFCVKFRDLPETAH